MPKNSPEHSSLFLHTAGKKAEKFFLYKIGHNSFSVKSSLFYEIDQRQKSAKIIVQKNITSKPEDVTPIKKTRREKNLERENEFEKTRGRWNQLLEAKLSEKQNNKRKKRLAKKAYRRTINQQWKFTKDKIRNRLMYIDQIKTGKMTSGLTPYKTGKVEQFMKRRGRKPDEPDRELSFVEEFILSFQLTRKEFIGMSVKLLKTYAIYKILEFFGAHKGIQEITSELFNEYLGKYINEIFSHETINAENRFADYTENEFKSLIFLMLGDSWAKGKEDNVLNSEQVFHPATKYIVKMCHLFMSGIFTDVNNIAVVGANLNSAETQFSNNYQKLIKLGAPIDIVESGGGNNVDEVLNNLSSLNHLNSDLKNPIQMDTLRLIDHADGLVQEVINLQYENLVKLFKNDTKGLVKHVWVYGMVPIELSKGVVALLKKTMTKDGSGIYVIPQSNNWIWTLLEQVLSLSFQKRKREAITLFENKHPEAKFKILFEDLYHELKDNYTNKSPTILYEHGTSKGYMVTAYYMMQRMKIDGILLQTYLAQKYAEENLALFPDKETALNRSKTMVDYKFAQLLAGNARDLDDFYN